MSRPRPSDAARTRLAGCCRAMRRSALSRSPRRRCCSGGPRTRHRRSPSAHPRRSERCERPWPETNRPLRAIVCGIARAEAGADGVFAPRSGGVSRKGPPKVAPPTPAVRRLRGLAVRLRPELVPSVEVAIVLHALSYSAVLEPEDQTHVNIQTALLSTVPLAHPLRLAPRCCAEYPPHGLHPQASAAARPGRCPLSPVPVAQSRRRPLRGPRGRQRASFAPARATRLSHRKAR